MKRHIAIVEDEPALRENYAAALARNGYQVKTYANRASAMQAFNLHLPDLAIVDISLDDNTITSHVKRVRRKFQIIDPAFDAIQTVYGMGYRWVE